MRKPVKLVDLEYVRDPVCEPAPPDAMALVDFIADCERKAADARVQLAALKAG